MDNTVSDRRASRRDTFFRYVHNRLPNGARIGSLCFPEQALVYQCLDNLIRHLGVGQYEAAPLAFTVAALAARGGAGGGVRLVNLVTGPRQAADAYHPGGVALNASWARRA